MMDRYFLNRRPRGFHHTFRFSSERRDIIESLRHGASPDEVARQSLASGGDRAARRHDTAWQPSASRWIIAVALALLLALITAILI